MNIIACSICKKPFHSVGGRICGNCLERIDKDFLTVRDYIYEHKHSDIDKVSEATEVPKQIIMHLLKEGRLTLEDATGAGGGVLFCEVCKKPINTGRMCRECMDKVSNTMQKNVGGNKPPEPKKEEKSLKGSAKLQT